MPDPLAAEQELAELRAKPANTHQLQFGVSSTMLSSTHRLDNDAVKVLLCLIPALSLQAFIQALPALQTRGRQSSSPSWTAPEPRRQLQ